MTWVAALLAIVVAVGVVILVRLMRVGKITLDTGWGRTIHALGPIVVEVAAPRDLVYEQISAAYLGRTPASLRDHLEVVDRGTDLVLARHWSKTRFTNAQTLEIVGFEPSERVRFRHVRGPVPHAVEEFTLRDSGTGTIIAYHGEIGLDFWWFGSIAARRWVRPVWEATVRTSMESTKHGAEERAAARARREAR
ncbi:MAG: SRPBCC family protein [Acidimicrobiia bacterium]